MLKDKIQAQSPEVISEACAWIAQIETGDLTFADRVALREWLGRSPRHLDTLKKMAQVSMDMNVMVHFSGALEQAAVLAESKKKEVRLISKQWFVPFFSIATILLISMSFILFLLREQQLNERPMMVSTEKGGFEEVVLSDGSIVKVNTDSQLEVHYTNEFRKIRLLRGEAYFNVASNPRRPFLVYANGQYVRAVGTAFIVKALKERPFSVSVVEGKVEVGQTLTSDVGKDGQQGNREIDVGIGNSQFVPSYVVAGQRLSLRDDNVSVEINTISGEALERELSWQDGVLEFSETSLAEVFKELNRYSGMSVAFSEPAISEIRIGGIFPSNKPELVLDALEANYGIVVNRINPNSVVLSRTGR